jgi:hypothetical protein
MATWVGYALEAKAEGNASERLTWGRTPLRSGEQVAVKKPEDAGVIRAGGMRRELEP